MEEKLVLPPCDKCQGELYKNPRVNRQLCTYPPQQATICKDCGDMKWTMLTFL